MPSFTITVPDIHQGSGYLWYNVQMPANGARLMVDSNGNPVGGTPLPMGASEGAATFHMEAKIEEISIDQETAPVDAVMTAESAYLEVTLKESSLSKISKALAHAAYATGSDSGLPSGAQAYEEITVGGLVAIPQAPVDFRAAAAASKSPPERVVLPKLGKAVLMRRPAPMWFIFRGRLPQSLAIRAFPQALGPGGAGAGSDSAGASALEELALLADW